MKTFLAIGCATACALLSGCGNGTDVTTIESDQVRPPASAAPVDPPGSGIKLGSNNTGAPPASSKPSGN